MKIKVNQSEEFRRIAAIDIFRELLGCGGFYYVDLSTWQIYFNEDNDPWATWEDFAGVIPLIYLAPGVIEFPNAISDWTEAGELSLEGYKQAITFILGEFLDEIEVM